MAGVAGRQDPRFPRLLDHAERGAAGRDGGGAKGELHGGDEGRG